jgi:hypothetical protein
MGRPWCELQMASEQVLGSVLPNCGGGGWKNWLCDGDGG